MNVLLFILLGCNIPEILNNRIETAINFASFLNSTRIDWYLSGGIKNKFEDTVSEAVKMSNVLIARARESDNWGYIYDTYSRNTAENFIMVKGLVESDSIEQYSDVYVVTSDFHYNRAKQIADKIIAGNKFKWILGDAELGDSRYWETIHIKNVALDVFNAFNYYRLQIIPIPNFNIE